MTKQKRPFTEKPHFSGHETFPLRQLWLKKAYTEVQLANTNSLRDAKAVFSDERAIVRFGVGKNMVSAIRHWALACGIISESDAGYQTTELGNLIFGENGCDPYQEHPTTTWLIHWKLAGEGARSTTWKWLFNYIIDPKLDTEHLIQSLITFAKENEYKTANASLKRDLECCLRSYVPRVAGDSPEGPPERVADSYLSPEDTALIVTVFLCLYIFSQFSYICVTKQAHIKATAMN